MKYNQFRRLAVKHDERKWWIKHLLRPVSTRLTFLIKDSKILPNQITLLMIAWVFLSGFFFINRYFVLGSVTLLLTILMDAMDGELARYTSNVTKDGKVLDTIYHYITYPVIMLCLTISFKDGLMFLLGAVNVLAWYMTESVYHKVQGIKTQKNSLKYYLGQLNQDHNFIILITLSIFLGITQVAIILYTGYTLAKLTAIKVLEATKWKILIK